MIDQRSRGEVSDLLARTAEVQQKADELRTAAQALIDAPPSGRRARSRMVRRCYGANREAVSLARSAVVRLARLGSLPPGRQAAVRLAVSEAVTNAVVHAYGDGHGYVHVTAALAGDELIVLVADDGCGPRTPPRTARRGWGWTLIAAASDEFTISRRANGGTQVEMRWRVTTAAPSSSPGLKRPPDVLLAPPRFSTVPKVDRGVLDQDAETSESP